MQQNTVTTITFLRHVRNLRNRRVEAVGNIHQCLVSSVISGSRESQHADAHSSIFQKVKTSQTLARFLKCTTHTHTPCFRTSIKITDMPNKYENRSNPYTPKATLKERQLEDQGLRTLWEMVHKLGTLSVLLSPSFIVEPDGQKHPILQPPPHQNNHHEGTSSL